MSRCRYTVGVSEDDTWYCVRAGLPSCNNQSEGDPETMRMTPRHLTAWTLNP